MHLEGAARKIDSRGRNVVTTTRNSSSLAWSYVTCSTSTWYLGDTILNHWKSPMSAGRELAERGTAKKGCR